MNILGPKARTRPPNRGNSTYNLRRLRIHGFIRRIPRSHGYEVTPTGLRSALFLTRAHDRLLRPGSTTLNPAAAYPHPALSGAFGHLEAQIDAWLQREKLAA